jgi:lactoylglutathione lyase
MKMIRKIEQPEAKFDLYFMGFDSDKAVSGGKDFSDREGLIEVCWHVFLRLKREADLRPS